MKAKTRMKTNSADRVLLDRLAAYGYVFQEDYGTATGPGDAAESAWRAFVAAASESFEDLPAEDCDEDMLYFGAYHRRDEARYQLELSRTMSFYADGDYSGRSQLIMMIDFDASSLASGSDELPANWEVLPGALRTP